MLNQLLKDSGKRLVLGSQSPRRKELLAKLELEFECRPADIDESFDPTLSPEDVAMGLAQKKADHLIKSLQKDELLITSDTIVILDNHIINKPESEKEAIEMLKRLSGNTHEVISSICISDGEKQVVTFDKTKVFFNKLSDAEMEYYIRQYQPLDKAGAYGIQEWIGYIGINKIEGSFFTVMGLPVHLVYRELVKFLG